MSTIDSKLTLKFPSCIADDMEENMIGAPHKCPACDGKGWYWKYDNNTNESVKATCTLCEGTGVLVPYVNIHWGAPIKAEAKYNSTISRQEMDEFQSQWKQQTR